jgi:hypothetical protein
LRHAHKFCGQHAGSLSANLQLDCQFDWHARVMGYNVDLTPAQPGKDQAVRFRRCHRISLSNAATADHRTAADFQVVRPAMLGEHGAVLRPRDHPILRTADKQNKDTADAA